MAYRFVKNYLAPKCTEADNIDISRKSHFVLYDRCNFRCGYCAQSNYGFQNLKGYSEVSEGQFISTILNLMQSGKNFKFSGGEPTLNPQLERHLEIVKQFGGTVFLDTNGSRPQIVKKLLDKGLIDVLAVSLKGLYPEVCLKDANIIRQDFCWDNPLKTIEYGSHTPGVKVIITHVCFDDVSIEEFRRFADILEPYPGVFYKINNLHHSDMITDYKRADTDKIISLLKQITEERPRWKKHIIYVDELTGMTDYEKILFI